MEGGWKPWRTQRIEDLSADLDSFGKPLPPPPSGYFWERLADGSWELRSIKEQESLDGFSTFAAPTVLEHVVLPDDTIQGICLRYRISATDLRRYNTFSGNNIKFKKTLRIPVDRGVPISIQQETEEVVTQRFKNITQETTTESRLYLSDNNWDLEKALNAWKADEDWSKTHEPRTLISGTVCAYPASSSTESQIAMSTPVDEESKAGGAGSEEGTNNGVELVFKSHRGGRGVYQPVETRL